jgi:hypothetical protein
MPDVHLLSATPLEAKIPSYVRMPLAHSTSKMFKMNSHPLSTLTISNPSRLSLPSFSSSPFLLQATKNRYPSKISANHLPTPDAQTHLVPHLATHVIRTGI